MMEKKSHKVLPQCLDYLKTGNWQQHLNIGCMWNIKIRVSNEAFSVKPTYPVTLRAPDRKLLPIKTRK